MSQHRSLATRNESMRNSQPISQQSSASGGLSDCEPWLQSLHHDPVTTHLHFENAAGNYLESEGMGHLVPSSSDAANALQGPHHANTLEPEESNGIYHLHAGLFDPSLHYSVPKNSLDSNEDPQHVGLWNHEVDTGVETSAVNLEFLAQYGPMSVEPTFGNYEAAMPDFGPCSVGLDQRSSVSPSQSSIATGTLSISATMDLTRRSSSVYPSQSIVSNSIERAQSDTHPSLISAVAAASASSSSLTTTTTKSVEASATATATATSTATASTTEGIAAPPQEVEAIVGKKRSQSMTATRARRRKPRTRSADTPNATEYPTSANSIPGMASAADGPPFSTLASHSKLNNVSQVPQVSQGSQRQRNRRAATKCREKTKAAIFQLEATEKAVTLEHMELSKTVADLRGEVLALKNQLLLHGNCECDIIQQYLRNAARIIGEEYSVNYKSSSQVRVAAARTSPPHYSRHSSYS